MQSTAQLSPGQIAGETLASTVSSVLMIMVRPVAQPYPW
jgi:hypothetical protein